VIGIVVVSHSRALAEAAVALAEEMVTAGGPVIAVAAGLDETTFGTDATAVAEAIGTADSPDGVLVLLDLGSALLSTELALEFVEPDVQERVLVTSAPLVEGLVAAVVLAATGAPLDAVADEARQGLTAKQQHLGDVPAPVEQSTPDIPEQTVELVVPNPHGLHARPAARLVALARSYDARLTLTNLDTGRGPVNAASLSLVATLDARQGHRVRAGASGPDAAAALAAVEELARTGFGDAEPAESGVERGKKSSPGNEKVSRAAGSGLDVAIGPAIVPATDVDLSRYDAGDAATELGRSAAAVSAATADLRRVRDDTAERVGPEEAAIFDAHLALLDDPELTEEVTRAIGTGSAAPAAWSAVLDDLAQRFASLDDPYQRARAQDVRAVRRQLLAALADLSLSSRDSVGPRFGSQVPGGGILVVPELDPATAATVDTARIQGIATRAGGSTGHGVIVARSRGIPIVTDIGDVPVAPGQLVAFDAHTDRFVVAPDERTAAGFRALLAHRATERAEALAAAHSPAVTTDGHTIAVLANVGSVDDARAAASYGAEGSGLVRTEVLFGDRTTAPSVDEQAETYLAIARALQGRPVTIRTWDAGGDKPLPFLQQPAEPNPFLGERGIRVFRGRPELLRDQLAAICRAARETPVRVMFPMVSTVDELAWAREQLKALNPPGSLGVGIMVEVPAAALKIAQLGVGLDFVSIGTNDLTQYTLAADRGNAAVASLADALDPAVLALVRQVTDHVDDVAVCGDLASDPDAAVLLAGLGVHELSATGPRIPLVKARLRGISLANATDLATRALTLATADQVRELVRA